MSDDAVNQATGKTWPQWFTILNKAGAKKMDHPAIAKLLSKKYKVPDWWCQMVTVGYEQAMQGRKPHQRPSGFEISVGKTLPLSMGTLYAAWMNGSKRQAWLKHPLTPTPTKQKRVLRFAWADGSPIEVRFDLRPSGGCRVMVQHSRLRTSREAKQMQAWWRSALARMAKSL